MMLKVQKKINPYETIEQAIDMLSFIEDINGYDIEQTTNDAHEMVYHLDIHFRGEEGATRITIPVLTAHQLTAREMLSRIMHTIGWRKESL